MFTRSIAFTLLLLSPILQAGQSLVLTPTSLGPLQLTGSPATVSETKLKRLFPEYTIRYEIHSGDSPDFHYFEVSSGSGEVLFTLQSFGSRESETRKTTAEVPISLLQIRSRDIPDIYGLRVGDRVENILAKRGNSLKVGAGHFDGLMGDGTIYYSLVRDSDVGPEGLTMEDAVKGNWQIRTITWPEAAWE